MQCSRQTAVIVVIEMTTPKSIDEWIALGMFAITKRMLTEINGYIQDRKV